MCTLRRNFTKKLSMLWVGGVSWAGGVAVARSTRIIFGLHGIKRRPFDTTFLPRCPSLNMRHPVDSASWYTEWLLCTSCNSWVIGLSAIFLEIQNVPKY